MRGALALLMASLLVSAAAQSAPAVVPPVQGTSVPTRESRLELPFDAPREATGLVLAQTLPPGASYLPGSSRLNGQPLPDPLVGRSGRLYWPLMPTGRGVLTYRVSHTAALGELPRPSLFVRYPRDRQETLQGPFDLQDYASATPGAWDQGAENPGALRLPLDGSVIRDRDRITVVVQGPAGETLGPSINGEALPDAAIGQRDVDSENGTQRVTYFGIRLKTGVNVLGLGGEQVRVYYAGQAARVDVQAVQALADGSTPLRFRLRALDASGLTTAQPTLTVHSSIEPSLPDADPVEGGYQVALQNGEGELVLPPQSAPGTLTLDFPLDGGVQRRSIAIRPDVGTLGIGAASATLGLSGGQTDFRWSAKGYFEGTLGSGKLYAAANKDGLPGTTNPNTRFPLYGDASSETVPLQGQDPVAFRYDYPDFSVQYRLSPTPIDVLPLGESFTALGVSTKGKVQVGGFAALLSSDRISGERITPNGTRLLRLAHGDIVPDSETLELLTLDRVTGQELSRRTLTRYADYVLDTSTGVITLSSALPRTDEHLNTLVLQAAYRLNDGGTHRTLAYGAQARYATQNASVGVAAVNLDGKLTVGARATLNTPALSGSALAMTQGGGVQLSTDLSGRLGTAEFGVRAAYQDAAYAGLAPIAVGLNASGLLRQPLAPGLSASLGGEYASSAAARQGNVAARLDYQLNPFTVGGGLRYSFGDQTGLSGLLGLGYHAAPLDVDVTHSQPLGGDVDPETVLTVKYALAPNVRLKFTDDLNWKTGQTASFGIDTTLGGTNLSAAYDLPNASGSGNRARFGVDTSLPLDQHFTLGVRGAYLRDMTAGSSDFSVGSDLRYLSGGLSAALGVDVANNAGEWRTVLRAGATGSLSETFSVTADATTELSRTPGSRFAVGYAWRDGAWNSLGFLRYQVGSLAGNQPQLLGQFSAEYHRARYALRGGLDARVLLDDPGSFTYQPSLGGTYYVTDRLGLGLSARALIQPATGSHTFGVGLEGSLRALPGTWLTLGYNVLGFDGIGNTFTKPGPYVRLDLLLDEQGGQK
ncbi:hypothetical protein E5F05_03165 (plasmid) [Deinococcus metallilatus]|uniref:Uncharacterized protein n=1 Tax=Deinococcus metallilatus TaxID=1211322 RepID=A0AAJ5F8H7_9DEIO|nr:hypothetical protein [Deinococcus metallilatus]MBB5297368.1 hypothetical protein [Deinococcus metallilatus]QBY06933.1 hypothetical protein E5F05_03165 [Deinococcus metallilatus]TLK32323.1 hypothetical protein FCS05_02500 [Deinococcus metallilatus]GMA17073.1 hypothetical protein GCM10025871_34040 [Deinococcus metallilatus]